MDFRVGLSKRSRPVVVLGPSAGLEISSRTVPFPTKLGTET